MTVFDKSEFEKHTAEARENWGQTPAYEEFETKTKDYSKSKWNDLAPVCATAQTGAVSLCGRLCRLGRGKL